MKILFITSTYFGDAVVSTGLLGHLIDRYPEARITIICGRQAAPLFTAVPNLERIIPVVKRKHHLHWFGLWRACIGTRWDIVVDLRASALAYLLLAKKRLPFRPVHLQGGHRTAEWAHLLGLETLPRPRAWIGPEQEAAAAALVPDGPPVLGIGPTANSNGKIWRPEYFAELAQRLTANDGILPGGRIAVFGIAGDTERVQPLLDSIPKERLINLIGRTDLLTAAAVLKRCSLYVGNDSGPLYLSVATDTPGLGLLGPSPGLFGPKQPPYAAPWAKKTAIVRTAIPYEKLVGTPGYDAATTDTLMDSLSVDAAEAGARELWDRCHGTDDDTA